ncbi:hypothetical protein OAB47_04090 [Vicingaceae bacterium]|nr:hypothetical protein [Vicingaceae bacterium]
MEELNKDELKKLQLFFKQRSKQNEPQNEQVVEHIGSFLALIDTSKLNESQKVTYNKLINALGNFIVVSKQKWEIKSALKKDFSVDLLSPKGSVCIIDADSAVNSEQLNDQITEKQKLFSQIIIISSNELEITQEYSNTGTSWFYNTESGSFKKL